jgi:hypothetical protein
MHFDTSTCTPYPSFWPEMCSVVRVATHGSGVSLNHFD